ncbi:cell division protein FtsX [Robinsoniella peoriensis]|uniref:cell division protein FtsX n=1 Tax=Robinsoniella peoriensis TaxID=180332 RepID=UPI00085C8F6C|nr:permease-like cell division protein FtsX [Robinsoniella peoriensis]
MEFSTLSYLIKMGLKNIRRNKVYMIGSVVTMSICIFLFGIFFISLSNVESILKTAEDEMSILVFFQEGIEKNKIEEIGQQIRQQENVIETNYVSADAAWEEFQKKIFEDDETVADDYKDTNPLAQSDHYMVRISGIENQTGFVTYVKGLEGVRKVTHSETTVRLLSTANRVLAMLTAGCMLLLVLISLFLVNNTLAVGMESRKDKIKVMQLMGAKPSFIKVPFIVEGLFIGIFGTGIPLFVLFIVYEWVMENVNLTLGIFQKGIPFLSASSIFPVLTVIAGILGIGTGLFGSLFTIKRHLKV